MRYGWWTRNHHAVWMVDTKPSCGMDGGHETIRGGLIARLADVDVVRLPVYLELGLGLGLA